MFMMDLFITVTGAELTHLLMVDANGLQIMDSDMT